MKRADVSFRRLKRCCWRGDWRRTRLGVERECRLAEESRKIPWNRETGRVGTRSSRNVAESCTNMVEFPCLTQNSMDAFSRLANLVNRVSELPFPFYQREKERSPFSRFRMWHLARVQSEMGEILRSDKEKEISVSMSSVCVLQCDWNGGGSRAILKNPIRKEERRDRYCTNEAEKAHLSSRKPASPSNEWILSGE